MANTTILLVEDEANIAELVTLILRPLGALVVHRSNAMDALSFLDQFTPDLIILDIGMPVMNGWQFLNQIQDDPQQNMIPVIVLTAFTDAMNRMEGQMQGVKAYLDKPVMPDQLRGVVQRILGAKT